MMWSLSFEVNSRVITLILSSHLLISINSTMFSLLSDTLFRVILDVEVNSRTCCC